MTAPGPKGDRFKGMNEPPQCWWVKLPVLWAGQTNGKVGQLYWLKSLISMVCQMANTMQPGETNFFKAYSFWQNTRNIDLSQCSYSPQYFRKIAVQCLYIL